MNHTIQNSWKCESWHQKILHWIGSTERERCNFDCGNFWKAGKAEAMIATKQTPAKKTWIISSLKNQVKKWNWFLGKWAFTFVLGKLNIVAESWKVVHLLQNKGLRLVLSLSNKGPLAVDVATGLLSSSLFKIKLFHRWSTYLLSGISAAILRCAYTLLSPIGWYSNEAI